MPAGDGERGQATAEYVGLIILVSLIAAAFAAVSVGPGIPGAVEEALCRAVGAQCSGAGSGVAAGPAVPLADPMLTDLERRILLLPDPQYADYELEPFSAPELAWLELNDPEAYEAALRVRSWSEERDLLDQALDADLDTFAEYRDSEGHDPRMDYSEDGCSVPVIGPSGDIFEFRPACERHDFGYRNAKRLGLFDGYKRRIDAVFAKDLYDRCGEVFFIGKKQCKTFAAAYYSAVRVAGGHCNPPGPVGRIPGPCAPENG